jgi:hypothetical protein
MWMCNTGMVVKTCDITFDEHNMGLPSALGT